MANTPLIGAPIVDLIAPYMPDFDTVVSIVAAVVLLSCWPLIALGVLGVMNAICRWKCAATDEDMAALQRRMLWYAVKDPKEVEKLYRVMQIWGKAVSRRRDEIPESEPDMAEMPESANVIDFQKWRDQNVEVMQAAE